MVCTCIGCHRTLCSDRKGACHTCREDNKVIMGEITECNPALAQHMDSECPVLNYPELDKLIEEERIGKQVAFLKRQVKEWKLRLRAEAWNKREALKKRFKARKSVEKAEDIGGIDSLKRGKKISIMGYAKDTKFDVEKELENIK